MDNVRFTLNQYKLRKQGFPSVTESITVKEHLEAREQKKRKRWQQKKRKRVEEYPLQLELFVRKDVKPSLVKDRRVDRVSDGCCVWGWWRKGWERNERLLAWFQERCSMGEAKPDVILYNQYLRRAYLAKLHAVYFVPKASTVEIPQKWMSRCPERYVSAMHLCGAYFVIEMVLAEEGERVQEGKPIEKDPNILFKEFRVDELSFPILGEDFDSVISLPEGIGDICADLVDKSPTPQRLKATEHTMFALRKKSQEELTKQLLAAGADDDELVSAFKCTEWGDIEKILLEADVEGWKTLLERPKTLKAISGISPDRKVIGFDAFLVGWAVSSARLSKDLIPSGDEREQQTNTFRARLVEWLLDTDVLRKREKAARLFTLLWSFMQERYNLASITGYFAKLPNMEEIAYSTQYGLKHKFYRDHLNHNVRAGLLAGYLAEKLFDEESEGYNKVLVAFLAGLLHDLAHPLASYEKVGKAIEETLGLLKLPIASRVGSLIEHNTEMQESICIVALVSSMANLEEKQKKPLLLWKFRDEVIDLVDPCLLFEEMACAMCDAHAFLSAVVILNAASFGNEERAGNFRVRNIVQQGSGDGADQAGVEFLNLIQSIALHDRKVSSSWHGGREEQEGIPVVLDFSLFPVPTLIVVTDDLQEWGRPVGDFRRTLVTECDIVIRDEKLVANYSVSVTASAIGSTAYSFLEHFLAKVRNLSQIRRGKVEFHFEVVAKIDGELTLNHCGLVGGELVFDGQDTQQVTWPYGERDRVSAIRLTGDRAFLRLDHAALKEGDETVATSDFIILNTGECAEEPSQILDTIGERRRVRRIRVEPPDVEIETANCRIEGRIGGYHFCRLKQEGTSVKGVGQINFSERVGILEIIVKRVDRTDSIVQLVRNSEESHHRTPCPHFLDLDWRFSSEAVYAIIQFVNEHLKGGKVCYLGCPTLAIYHETIKDVGGEYTLLDKGHHGIETWCERGLIDRARVVRHDVFRALPEELMHEFDMVIMDAPWYEEHHEVFWYRALELVKSGKLIGVVEYPGYKDDKLSRMELMRKSVVKGRGGRSFFASIEISYDPPEFEKAWGGDKMFAHTAIGAYRPAYMDFYEIEQPRVSVGDVRSESEQTLLAALPKVIPLEEGHYLKCVQDLKRVLKKGRQVKAETRKDLRRRVNDLDTIIAWSTRNTVVRLDEGEGACSIGDEKVLVEVVKRWEVSGGAASGEIVGEHLTE